MCFDHDSLPPIPALSGAAVSHDDLVLEAADGNRFAAFAATPEEPTDTGVAILALQAGLDENILAEHNAAFDAALTAAGVEHDVVTYEGAPHSFFDRKQEQFADASDDAWRRVLAFLERYR